jgi:hypothetical protein
MSDDHWTTPLPDVIKQIGINAEQVKLVILARTTQSLWERIDQLRLSMESNAASNDELAKKVHRLNVVLTWATVIGSLAAIAGVIIAITRGG